MMKKMKRSEKVFRTLLIAVMGVVLSGVTLATAFATYEIKIEHIFEDYSNGTTIKNPPPSYSAAPRDDLLDDLGGDGLNVGVQGTGTDEDGNHYQTTVDTKGTESGNDVGVKQAVSIVKDLLDAFANEETNEAAGTKIESIEQKVNALDGQNPDDMKVEDESGNTVDKYPVKEQPAGEAPPVVPEKPEAKVEDPGEAPQAPERGEDESEEAYAVRFQEFKDTVLKEYNEQHEAYTADQKRLADEQAKYDADMKALEEWLSNPENKLEDWQNWEKYKDAKAEYLNKLDELSQELREWYKAQGKDFEGLNYDELTDKALKESYQKAYLEVCKELKGFFDTMDANKIKENLDNKLTALPELNDEVAVDTWQAENQKFQETDGATNLFEFKAWLSEESKKTLEDAGYTSAGTPFKITVVGVKVDKDGNKITQTYISSDDGKTWYAEDDVDKNGVPKQNAKSVDTDALVKDGGYITNAITFTFLHKWEPPKWENNDYTGDTVDVTPPPASASVPPSEPPASEPPEVPLDDPETPLDEIELPLEEIPLTADISYLWYMAALISAAGLFFLVRRNQKSA